MTAPNSTTEAGVTEAEVDTYCDAWGASFRAENPFYTVSCGPSDRVHIKAGLKAFAQSRQSSAQGGERVDRCEDCGDAVPKGTCYCQANCTHQGATPPATTGMKESLVGDAERPRYTINVRVGDGAVMDIPNPLADPHIEWSLRYAGDLNSAKAGRFSAAAVVESFDYLVSDQINLTEASKHLRILRDARSAAIRAGRKG